MIIFNINFSLTPLPRKNSFLVEKLRKLFTNSISLFANMVRLWCRHRVPGFCSEIADLYKPSVISPVCGTSLLHRLGKIQIFSYGDSFQSQLRSIKAASFINLTFSSWKENGFLKRRQRFSRVPKRFSEVLVILHRR